MERINLNGTFRGECVGAFTFEANVPGCTISDLVENGYLPKDLLVGKNADAVRAFENDDWIYTKVFSQEKAYAKAVLSFERIDTYADIYLNGAFVAHTENGNIGYTFDVSDLVCVGENTLEIRFFSPVKQVSGLPKRSGAFTTERLYTRRMQCTYGWDWVARFVCCGIGDAALLCYESGETVVKDTYIFTDRIEGKNAFVKIEAELENAADAKLSLAIAAEDGRVVYDEKISAEGGAFAVLAEIENAALWYPVGYGKQPLYTLYIKDGARVLREERFGIRTVEILEVKDEEGSEAYEKCLSIKNYEYDFNTEFSSFALAVNGIRIMCKGANWVPCHPYEMQGKEKKITETLELSVEMGLNMIRVWGGGAFECKHFYDECTRLGILVTQDFLMACGSYPEKEEWFLEHLRREAEYACRLMRNEACLAYYSGDNENAVHGSFTDEDYRGKSAYEKGLKPIVEVLDRSRRILPSSPYGGNKFASNTVGTTHNTQFLGHLFQYIESGASLADYKEELKKYRARFIAEEPVFGAVSLSSLRKFMTEEEIFSEDMTDAWLYHTKGNPGLPEELMMYFVHFCEKIFGEFKNPKDRYFKYKYLAYEWLRVMMEQARREYPFCTGEIFWMLNDCWTAASGWALIDYFNKPKLGYYSFKRAAKPIVASLDFENGAYALYVSNNELSDFDAEVTLYKVRKDEAERIDAFKMHCPANASAKRSLSVSLAENEALIADLGCAANDCRAFYKHGDLQIEPCEGGIECYAENGAVTLVAKEYLHAVELEGEAIFEENGFSMLAGERRTVGYRYLDNAAEKEIRAEAYTLSILKK